MSQSPWTTDPCSSPRSSTHGVGPLVSWASYGVSAFSQRRLPADIRLRSADPSAHPAVESAPLLLTGRRGASVNEGNCSLPADRTESAEIVVSVGLKPLPILRLWLAEMHCKLPAELRPRQGGHAGYPLKAQRSPLIVGKVSVKPVQQIYDGDVPLLYVEARVGLQHVSVERRTDLAGLERIAVGQKACHVPTAVLGPLHASDLGEHDRSVVLHGAASVEHNGIPTGADLSLKTLI
jgi:hypothetical protein